MNARVVWRGETEIVLDPEEVEAPSGLQPEVDAAWEAATRHRPGLTDDLILSVTSLDVQTRRVEVRRCRYRLFLARETNPVVRRALAIRPLGVSGLVKLGADVVVGRRADDVTEYPGAWELVPSGGIVPPATGIDVDARAAFLLELEEEAGIGAEQVECVDALGLAHDADHDTFDVCFTARVSATRFRPNEYSRIETMPLERAGRLLTAEAAVPVSRLLLAERWA